MRFALDSNVLGVLCHRKHKDWSAVAAWLTPLIQDEGTSIFLPAIADYELRRKLLHLDLTAGSKDPPRIAPLDALRQVATFIPLTDRMLADAAKLWAEARRRGKSTAADSSIDGDVILAAQALSVGATVVTENIRHLSRYCNTTTWRTPATTASTTRPVVISRP